MKTADIKNLTINEIRSLSFHECERIERQVDRVFDRMTARYEAMSDAEFAAATINEKLSVTYDDGTTEMVDWDDACIWLSGTEVFGSPEKYGAFLEQSEVAV